PERIRTLKLPTLILWGARDRLVPPASAHHFQQDIAGSQLVIFPRLAHVPHEEDPQDSVVPVRAFLGLDTPSNPVAAPAAAEPAASGSPPPAAASSGARSAEKS
ncbi:MAG: alpha/beta fold hydrolase, partial [Vitreoscilla sp.]